MDVVASHTKLVSENIISCTGQSLMGLHYRAYGCLKDFDASELGDHLNKCLNIKEGQESSNEIKPKFNKDDNYGSKNTHYSHSGNLAAEKFAAVPCSSKSTSPSESIDSKVERKDDVTSGIGVLNDDESSANQVHSHSKSLPKTPLKLTSAMKGSREKLGIPPKKLSVKWAPDVYDPIPTSVSHVPKNKPRHRSDGRKSAKNKQKNSAKSSRGHKGKDKKQVRKHGSSSSNSNRDFHTFDMLEASSPSSSSVVDFDIDSSAVSSVGIVF